MPFEYSFIILSQNETVVIIGNEANGICSEILDLCEEKLKIPMLGSTESLNASVAAAVTMYEVLRQRL